MGEALYWIWILAQDRQLLWLQLQLWLWLLLGLGPGAGTGAAAAALLGLECLVWWERRCMAWESIRETMSGGRVPGRQQVGAEECLVDGAVEGELLQLRCQSQNHTNIVACP